jgi:hypothetical protein
MSVLLVTAFESKGRVLVTMECVGGIFVHILGGEAELLDRPQGTDDVLVTDPRERMDFEGVLGVRRRGRRKVIAQAATGESRNA